jgi:D-arabinan exo alpha-(1,3)/(1,5)-arabinofuranosidase (non-reducing end)
MQKQNVDLIPVTIHEAPLMFHIYKKDSIVNLKDSDYPNAWTNFYRSDDIAATAYFYLDKPRSELPVIQDVEIRNR